MNVTPEQIANLGEPTPLDEIKKRPIFNKNKEKIGELDYIDARYVMDRLDACVGPANWQNQYSVDANGNLTCGIGILVDGTWVWKWDVGTESTIEETKGSYSDAFKRAAVHWGIARDLYDTREGQSSTGSRVHQANGTSSTQTRAATGRPTSFPVDPADAPWSCPIHHSVVAWPAGTSAQGRKYDAFYACAEGRSCDQRPPYGLKVRAEHLSAPQQQEVPFA